MAAGHLVAHLDFAALCHIDPDHHVGSRGKFITLFTGVDANIHHAASLGAGNPQGVIAHIACFFTENGT